MAMLEIGAALPPSRRRPHPHLQIACAYRRRRTRRLPPLSQASRPWPAFALLVAAVRAAGQARNLARCRGLPPLGGMGPPQRPLDHTRRRESRRAADGKKRCLLFRAGADMTLVRRDFGSLTSPGFFDGAVRRILELQRSDGSIP